MILAAEVMDLLDAMITTIAAPSIQADLGGSTSMVQWLRAGYTLAMAVGLITGGRLGDLYGRRRVFVIGTLFFGLLKQGWSFEDAMRLTIWAEVGLLAITFAVAFLLPLRARPEEEATHPAG